MVVANTRPSVIVSAFPVTPALDAAVGTARHVVSWSRANPDLARVLLYRPSEFDSPRWPEADFTRVERANGEIGALLTRIAGGLREPDEETAHALERVRLAVVDLPLALVMRSLLGGRGFPEDMAELAADSARRLPARNGHTRDMPLTAQYTS